MASVGVGGVHRVLPDVGLVADDRTVRGAVRARGEPDPAVAGVRAQERHVGAGVPGAGDGRAPLRRPVLVVPEGVDRGRAPQDGRVTPDVRSGGVGQRDPGPFGQHDERPLVGHEPDRSVPVVGPVEAHLHRTGPVAAVLALVQVVAAPQVVRLPGLRGVHDDGLARAVRRPYDQRDVALVTVAGVQPEQVRPLGPAASRHGQRRLPPRGHRAGGGGERHLVLAVAADLIRPPHQARLRAAVPADPVRRDPERGPGGRHVQREVLAGPDAYLAGVAFDSIGGAGRGDPEMRVAREVALGHRRGAGPARGAGRGPRMGRAFRAATGRGTYRRRRGAQERAALQSFACHRPPVLAAIAS